MTDPVLDAYEWDQETWDEYLKERVSQSLDNLFGFMIFDSEEGADGKAQFKDALTCFVPGRVLYDLFEKYLSWNIRTGGGELESSEDLDQSLRSLFSHPAEFKGWLETSFLTYRHLFENFRVLRASRDYNFDAQIYVGNCWKLLKTEAFRSGGQPYPIVQKTKEEEHLPNVSGLGKVLFGEERSDHLDVLINNFREFSINRDIHQTPEWDQRFRQAVAKMRAAMEGQKDA
jgi:hypothetical protein